MMKNKKKNDKFIIFLVFFLLFAFLSWIFGAHIYQSGELIPAGMRRAGLYDLLVYMISGFTYKFETVLYILSVGGIYGILVNTESYKKVVHKVTDFIKGKEKVVFAVLTFFIAVYTSMSMDIMALFFLVPFIMTVFLRAGQDKLTAVSASFGGMFIGYLGQTAGDYGSSFLTELFKITATSGIIAKIIIFILAYVLFNVFAILHMNSSKEEDEEESADMFAVSDLKKVVKKRDKVSAIPLVVIAIISLIIIMIGYIPWNTAFNITFFDTVHTAVTSVKIAGIAIFKELFGPSMTAFGTWTNMLPAVFILLIGTFIVGKSAKLTINEMITYFGKGVRKISSVALIFGLAYSIFYLYTAYPWPTSLINKFLNPESFNIIMILIAAILSVIFCADPLFSGYYFGSYFTTLYASNAIATSIIWRIGNALALLVGPTSFLLLVALVYADVPYTKWLKYIWKFVGAFVIVSLISLAIMIYI